MLKKALGIMDDLLGNKGAEKEKLKAKEQQEKKKDKKIESKTDNAIEIPTSTRQTKKELTQEHIHLLNKAFNMLKNEEGITTIAELGHYLSSEHGFKAGDFIGSKSLRVIYSEIDNGEAYTLTQDEQKTHIIYIERKEKMQLQSRPKLHNKAKTASPKENSTSLFDFAWFRNGYEVAINDLQKQAIQEEWGKNNKYLKYYIESRFKITIEKYPELLFFTENKSKAYFNTGLLTNNWKDLYAYFNKKPATFNGKEVNYCFVGFVDENYRDFAGNELPDTINFFKNAEDIYFDASLDIKYNENHILEHNIDRFPEFVKRIPPGGNRAIWLDGIIKHTKKRIQRNYRTVIPQWYNGSLCFLLPLSFDDSTINKPELLLTCIKKQDYYWIATCLTPEMAYSNARIIAKPESDWLKP